MKAGLAQTCIAWEDKGKNFEEVQKYVKEAKKDGAEIIFFPEMSLTGFSMHTDLTGETGWETVNRVRTLAQKEKIAIGIGWTQKKISCLRTTILC